VVPYDIEQIEETTTKTAHMIEKITSFCRSSLKNTFVLIPLFLLGACNIDTITDHGVYQEAPVVSGIYHLTVMQSNDPSNLNGRSNTAVNLLDEMECLFITLELRDDGSLHSRYVDLSMAKDADGNYQFHCGPERTEQGTWSMEGNALKMDNTTFLIRDNQLIDARNRDTELIDLVIFTKAG
jgi:hypothetical protein